MARSSVSHTLGRAGLRARIARSRLKLLASVRGATSVVFFRSWGNVGDELIYAGVRRLFRSVHFEELSLREDPPARGELALIAGGGAWSQQYHEVLPAALRSIEERFDRVVVLPSSFDVKVDEVRRTLAQTKATVFARERPSLRAIDELCTADLALDTAFFFDFAPYRLTGSGLLEAFRTDAESARPGALPRTNRDISRTCSSLDEWLWTIARHRVVHTDRAHVMIAAALLGKRVQFAPSTYHKVPGIAEWALRGLPVDDLPIRAEI